MEGRQVRELAIEVGRVMVILWNGKMSEQCTETKVSKQSIYDNIGMKPTDSSAEARKCQWEGRQARELAQSK